MLQAFLVCNNILIKVLTFHNCLIMSHYKYLDISKMESILGVMIIIVGNKIGDLSSNPV